MSLPPFYFSKTQIALSTPYISPFDLSTPVWNFHTGVERSKVEVAIPLKNTWNLIFYLLADPQLPIVSRMDLSLILILAKNL